MKALKAVLLLVVLTPALSMAADKIAVINIETAIEQSKAGAEFTSNLRSKFTPKQEELKKIAENGQALKAEYEKSGVFLSEEERETKRFEIQQKAQEFEMMRRNLAKAMDDERREFLAKLRPHINTAIQNLTKEHDVDVILRQEAIIFAKPEVDLTSALTEQLNKVK